MTAIAVDIGPNIEAVLDQTLELNLPGLVTLEQARLLSGEIEPAGIGGDAGESARLTVYFGRRDNVRGVPAFEVICELLYRREIGGATAFLGVDGTAHGRRQQARSFSRNADLPVMVVAGGSGDRIGMMLPELAGLRICKRYGHLTNVPKLAAGVDDRGFPLWRKLTVYTSEAARHEGQPVDRAIVRRLRSAGVSGATTHRGFWGFHGDRPPHGDRLLNLERHAPTVTTVIDMAERIFAAFDIIDELTKERRLVTSETVLAVRADSGALPMGRGGKRGRHTSQLLPAH